MGKKSPFTYASASAFKGFPPATFEFLSALSRNNNREWFAANKQRYEDFIVAPALDFIVAFEAPLRRLSPHFLAIPKRVGGSMFRIYRDVRFSHNKSPYKTNIGIHFRHFKRADAHAPGYYLHIGLDECFLGAGIWHPDNASLQKIREAILERAPAWHAATQTTSFKRRFRFGGESLKRPPRGMTTDHPDIEDLKRKDFIAIQSVDPAMPQRPDLVKFVYENYAAATPLMRFLCRSQDVPFD